MTTCQECQKSFADDLSQCPDCGRPVALKPRDSVEIDELIPVCGDCHGLCCVALAFDWPHYKKPAGEPCKNLTEDFLCGIWDSLEEDGYAECRSFTCFGAGQATARFVEEKSVPLWNDDVKAAKIELNIFQQVYQDLYKSLVKKPPTVGLNRDDETPG